jgi:predicted ArsR family transcriptional regulator
MVQKIARKRQYSARELAEKWGVHPSTVRRHVAQPRAEYEAQSLSRAKPWEALGMSRATWYRRGKPAPPLEASGAELSIERDASQA